MFYLLRSAFVGEVVIKETLQRERVQLIAWDENFEISQSDTKEGKARDERRPVFVSRLLTDSPGNSSWIFLSNSSRTSREVHWNHQTLSFPVVSLPYSDHLSLASILEDLIKFSIHRSGGILNEAGCLDCFVEGNIKRILSGF